MIRIRGLLINIIPSIEIVLVISSLLIVACGQKPAEIDPAVQGLIDEFCQDAIQYGRNCNERSIDFYIEDDQEFQSDKNVSATTIAYCMGHDYISFRKSYWDKMNLQRRRQIVYHEMGHCLLDRHHDDKIEYIQLGSISYQMHLSIMATYYQEVDADIIDIFWKEYVKELFTHNDPTIAKKYDWNYKPI